jgi:hypothetical protein
MNADEALRQIAEIRARMAGSQVFRGYRSTAVAFSGVVASLASLFQHRLVPSPADDLAAYLALWLSVAGVSVLAAVLGLWSWSRSSGAGLGRERVLHAVELALPSLVVGALLTLIVARSAPSAVWMLPGLWSLLFSLAVFASRRILSPHVVWVGAHYVASGAACLLLGQEEVLAPWQMGLCFGGGQLLGASILYWTLEDADAA